MKQKYFSIHSGMIYEVSKEEASLLDISQVPLTGEPKSSCRKCYGRGWTDKDRIKNVYSICSCLRKKVDWVAYEERKKNPFLLHDSAAW